MTEDHHKPNCIFVDKLITQVEGLIDNSNMIAKYHEEIDNSSKDSSIGSISAADELDM